MTDKSARRVYLVLAGAAVITMLAIGGVFRTANRSILRHAPLVDAAMEVKLELTTAHLWFKEAISDDRHEDVEDVWRHLDLADWYARVMLVGGKNQEGAFVALDDPSSRELVRRVQGKLAEFRKMTIERWQAKEDSAIGSDIDQQYDGVFAEAIQLADDVETNIQQSIAAETSRFHQLLAFETLGAFVLFVFVAWTFRRHVVQLAERTEALQYEVAERTQAQKELSRLATFAELNPAPVMRFDLDGKVTDGNPAAHEIFNKGRLEGDLISKILPPMMNIDVKDYIRKGKISSREFRVGDKDFQFVVLGVPELGMGHIYGSDITERKQAEEELKDYSAALESANKALEEFNEAAEAATRAKSEFLANMSHEIRTPMTAILGFSEVLMGSVMDQEQLDAATTIRRNGEYLLEIINDILDLSKIEAGKLEVEQVQCSPCRILSEVVSLMRVRANAKNLSLEIEYDGPIPQSIQSDPTRLRQILINLIGNAVKFTEIGKVRLVASLRDAESDDPKMQFEVVDSGIGITEEQIAELFKPFHQADTSTTRRFGGTGLGLAISKRLAEKLGGGITVTSTPGEGATFTVTATTGPLDGVKLLDNPSEAEVSTDPDKRPAAAKAKLDCRVLLAEDGPDNQRLIAFLLKKAGAEVTVAENGQIAHDLALAARDEGTPFDVILMDVQMPVMNGYDATGKLREAGYTGPIIALTAHAMSTDRDKCLNAGCNDYMAKPIDRKRLISAVAEYASRQELHKGTDAPVA